MTAPPYEAVFLPQDTTSLLPTPAPTGAQPLPLQPAQLQMCGENAAVGPVSWPSGPTSWYALVTYPSCDLITMVALPSGKIVSAAYVRATTDSSGNKNGVKLVDATTSPVCSSTACAGQALPPSAGVTSDGALRSDAVGTIDALGPIQAEAGVSDAAATGTDAGAGTAGAGGASGTTGAGGTPGMGGTPGAAGASGSPDAGATGGAQGGALLGNQYPDDPYFGAGALGPSGIQIAIGPQPDLNLQAYVSLANASFVVSVGLTSSGLTLPGNGIYLHEGARGSSRIRLNVDPYQYQYVSQPGVAGVFVGAETDQARKYLYVIARDGTLRVIHVDSPGAENECETNADPLHLRARHLGREPVHPRRSGTPAAVQRRPGHSFSVAADRRRRGRHRRTIPPTPTSRRSTAPTPG